MNQESKKLILIGLIAVVVVAGGYYLLSSSTPILHTQVVPTQQTQVDVGQNVNSALFVRPDSYHTAPQFANAKVVLVEFGDFQCPACGFAHQYLKPLLEAYGTKVDFVFRHLPLPQHSNAIVAAEAAEAAGEQGKFWEMHDKLYEGQDEWSLLQDPVPVFVNYAKQLNLDLVKFEDVVKNNKFSQKIYRDLDDAVTLKVDSTPSFFLNQQPLDSFPTKPEFAKAIDSALE